MQALCASMYVIPLPVIPSVCVCVYARARVFVCSGFEREERPAVNPVIKLLSVLLRVA